MPIARTHVKKPFKPTLLTGICTTLALIAAAIIFVTGNHDYTDCKRYNYNSKLNGGAKIFDGKRYNIIICGSGPNNSHFFGDSMDTLELTVKSEQGELLAKRHYKVFWEGQPGHKPLVIGPNSITYQDDEEQAEHSIAMPPTTIDWLRARLPFFN